MSAVTLVGHCGPFDLVANARSCIYRATSLADALGVDFALINRNRKREQNKRIRAAQRTANGLSARSSFSDLRSGMSTPMTASFHADQNNAHSSKPTQLVQQNLVSDASAKLAELKVGDGNGNGNGNGCSSSEAGPSRSGISPEPGFVAQADGADRLSAEDANKNGVGGATRHQVYGDIANGVTVNESGEWIMTDEQGHRIRSGGHRMRDDSADRASEDDAESKMEILVGDVAGKVSLARTLDLGVHIPAVS